MLQHITPRGAYKWSVRTAAVSAPLAIAMLVAWGLKLHPLGARPQLVLMLYMLFLLVGGMAFCVAVLSSCHMAIAKAFSHGYANGLQMAAMSELARPVRESRPGAPALRAVE